MCVIIDADVVSEIFRVLPLTKEDKRPEAGKEFFDWLDLNSDRLVIGGSKLKKELNIESLQIWLQEVDRRGKRSKRKYDDREIDQRAKELRAQNACKSNDEHIIALAQISNARLLYSKDKCLHEDFGTKELIDRPRGKVYSTLKNPKFDSAKDNLLRYSSCKQG